MNDFNFKAGDKVYCPTYYTKILTVTEIFNKNRLVLSESIEEDLFIGGTGFNGMPLICHATQENYELLSKLYPNVEFEQPPSKEPKEVIDAMLDYGYHGVLCQIAIADEDDDSIIRCYRYDYALEVLDDKIIFSHRTMHNNQLKFVSPFHQKSGMEIVDFVNGKIVLQNGEVVLEGGNDIS